MSKLLLKRYLADMQEQERSKADARAAATTQEVKVIASRSAIRRRFVFAQVRCCCLQGSGCQHSLTGTCTLQSVAFLLRNCWPGRLSQEVKMFRGFICYLYYFASTM